MPAMHLAPCLYVVTPFEVANACVCTAVHWLVLVIVLEHCSTAVPKHDTIV